MPDLAHDASGPASSEPAGVALQQAGRPASSEKGKLRVFISYSRDDLNFADQLDAALSTYGFECLIDRHDISGGEDWKRRLGNLISEADTIVFVLSPSSARSPICDWEVEEAARLNKRILPVNCRPLEGASPPPRLKDLNYIYFCEEPKFPGSGFGTGLASLIGALNTDFDWLRDHTRYLQRAIEWDTGGRPADRLLSGDDIAEAKAWAARRPKSAPEPTALQLEFFRASEEEAAARLSERRKQLEEVAAAQGEREKALRDAEEALKQGADAQRRRAKVRNIALVAVSGLAAVAVLFALLANQEKKTAEDQRQQADDILSRAGNMIADLGDRMDVKTQQEAFALFQAGARHGNANAMSNIGAFFEKGYGVPQDYAKAREWFEKAAARDSALAMLNLGVIYGNGEGVARDYAKARDWYEKAAAEGNAGAMNNLGVLYENGRGVPQDHAKARELYEKAAAKDLAAAMTNLGFLYEDGDGVPRDYVRARELFEKAAAKDLVDAMVELGVFYEKGYGGPQDYTKAREWYEKAVAKDNAGAMDNLGSLYANGQGVAQNYNEARELFQKAADEGDVMGMTNLGLLYENGLGVARDDVKARELYELAAEQKTEIMGLAEKSDPEAAQGLERMARDFLQAKQFTDALILADRAHALFPDGLAIDVVRAHALMFMGQNKQAMVFYLAHKGEPVPERNNLWEQAIAEDFANFRKAGLTNPMMADIEKELGISP
jgi:TPR repeat protein